MTLYACSQQVVDSDLTLLGIKQALQDQEDAWASRSVGLHYAQQ